MKRQRIVSIFSAVCCFVLSVAWLPAPCQSQNSPNHPEAQTKQPLVVDVDLVNLAFSAVDKKGKIVTDLSRNDVRVREDDREQVITSFSQEKDYPLAIAMLIDTSTSLRDKLKVEQEAAIDFFHTTVRRKLDKAMLISFDSTIDVLQQFTDDADQLTKAIRRLKPGGGTTMFDAIRLACQDHLNRQEGKRRILVLISDGDDNMSFESLNSTLEIAQRTDVSIFTISTNTSGFFGMESPKNDKTLKRLAEDTGGRAFFPNKLEEMAVDFLEISQELRNQYSLAFRSTNRKRDGSFRSIKIDSNRRDIKLQHRKGYYSPTG